MLLASIIDFGVNDFGLTTLTTETTETQERKNEKSDDFYDDDDDDFDDAFFLCESSSWCDDQYE